MSGFRWRFVWPVTLGTLCLVALCAFTAVSLFHQQATITGVLRENVSSRRAAADLRGCLNILLALETHQVESAAELHALHTRALGHLTEIRQLANHPTERDYSRQLDDGFAGYLKEWQSLPPTSDPAHEQRVKEATDDLEANVLLPCRRLEEFNDGRVEETTTQHERVLNQLAWGMAGVAGLGAVAGIVLGFGVARGLTRSIHRLQVRIQDAAGKLAHATLPEIVFIGEVGFDGLHGQIDRLTSRIEQIVQQLHEREREVVRAEHLAAVGPTRRRRRPRVAEPAHVDQDARPERAGGRRRHRLTSEDLRVIESEIRRMERSLQTFLEFARPPKLERRPVELGAVLDAVLGLVRGRSEQQRVGTAVELRDGPITLAADAGQLQQVFVNLVLNALDAMPTGGTLTLSARRAGKQVEVEVSDTGPGVQAQMVPRLFQPFASSKDTGLGLGLVISRRIVEDHGGTVNAGNRAGGGASFFVRLPVEG